MTKNCRLRRYITLHTAYSALVQLSATEALLVWERGPMASRCFPVYPNCSKLCVLPFARWLQYGRTVILRWSRFMVQAQRPLLRYWAGEYQTLRARRFALPEGP